METHELATSPLIVSRTDAPSISRSGSSLSYRESANQSLAGRASSRTSRIARSTASTAYSESVRRQKPRTKVFAPFTWVSRQWNKSWTAEVCACVLATVSLFGLILTLLTHQDKPLPEWPQLITINSIISLFALVIRASVGVVLAEGISQLKWQWYLRPRRLSDVEYFDAASRGAWGSIMFMSLGAFTTLLATLTGFFTQQLVQFQDCQDTDPAAVARVFKANKYDAAGPRILSTADIYPPMVAAISTAIIQPTEDYTKILSFGCPTGNCTFSSDEGAAFSTLAIAHKCMDISRQAIRTYQNDDSTEFEPAGVSLNLTNGNISLSYLGGTVVLSTGLTILGFTLTCLTQMLYRPQFATYNYSAIQCSILPVVNTYGVTIENAILKERLLKTLPVNPNIFTLVAKGAGMGPFDEGNYYPYKLATSQTLRNGSCATCERRNTSAPNYTAVMSGNVDIKPAFGHDRNYTDEDAITWYYPDDCLYSITAFSLQGILSYFREIFDAQQLSWGGSWFPNGNFSNIYLRQIFQDGNMTLASVDKIFQQVARSMTAVIRTHGIDPPLGQVTGKMWYNTTCVQIKWAWITFPAVMIGLTAVFLALISYQTRGVDSN